MASVDSLTAAFYDNEQYSDIIIKFGEHQIRAHKVILAQQSGYFATAFLDDPQLLTDVIKYLYHHGPIFDYNKGPDRLSMGQLINAYLLADKYDIRGLRRTMAMAFNEMALKDLRELPLTIHLCQEYSSSLFKNEMFLQKYMKGELFDNKHASAFGIKLGKYMLKSKNIPHEEANRLSKDWTYSLIGVEARQRNTKNFFDDKRFSDVCITYGVDKTIVAHKIILATHSRKFALMLADSSKSAEIDLRNENSSAAVATFIEDMYIPEYPVPDIKQDPSFFAELYLLAKKHGRDDVARTYLRRFNSTMYQEPFADKYLSYITDFCGPGSCRYTDTDLPEVAFDNILDRVFELKEEGATKAPCKSFAQKLKDGSLFNTVFMVRLANEMTSRYLNWRSESESSNSDDN
ncbi:unnamed protein product [Aureobasidium mustum]|uniref:BTB domain-containing protein n=1 Tax=Aureobasidium mustum TaxID=2773714 RepID=A0A9N8PLS2_9PEZI|nr:unnamed protein product [Aureobasidium mustum]